MFTTIKEAEAAGYREYQRDEYGGLTVEVEGVQMVRFPILALTKTSWGQLGYRKAPGTARRDGRRISSHRYRHDQVTPARDDVPPSPATYWETCSVTPLMLYMLTANSDFDPRIYLYDHPSTADVLRFLHRNPFDPTAPDAPWVRWNGGAALRLVQEMQRTGQVDQGPLLADMLEDAGCTYAGILVALRGNKTTDALRALGFAFVPLGTFPVKPSHDPATLIDAEARR